MSEKLSPGSYVVGLKQCIKSISAKKAKKVFLASDADYYISEKVSDACADNGVDIQVSYTMDELGKMSKIEVGAAVVTII